MYRNWLGAVVVLIASLWATAAHARVVDLEQRGEAVVGVDAEGAAAWKIRHKFDEADGAFPHLRFEPVVDGRRAYYAVRADLLTVDLDAGRITARRRFPGVIDAMRPDEDGYTLTLLTRARPAEEGGTVEVHYTPGNPAPGRGPFEPVSVYAAKKDADALVDRRQEQRLDAFDADQAEQALARLAAHEARDPTNLLLPIYRGRILQGQQRDQEAEQAFARALDVDDDPWTDDFYASSLLARYGVDDVSAQLFERARRKMLAHGVRPERLTGLVFQVVLTHPLADAIRQAFKDGDVERVDRLSERIVALSPHPEMAGPAWQRLADWMDEHDRPELAEKWRSHGREAANAPMGAFN